MMQSAADRLAVIETCTRVAWHADEREWDALRDLFAEEVRLDYTSLQGGGNQQIMSLAAGEAS